MHGRADASESAALSTSRFLALLLATWNENLPNTASASTSLMGPFSCLARGNSSSLFARHGAAARGACARGVKSGHLRSRRDLPGWPPILRRSPFGGAGRGGFTMSDGGGFEELHAARASLATYPSPNRIYWPIRARLRPAERLHPQQVGVPRHLVASGKYPTCR